MSRPALRMCARCKRTTDEPVLVREVHVDSGPGFNVYACSECAAYYPPMADVLEVLDTAQSRSRLTLRVYKVDTDGAVTEDRGEVEILVGGRAGPVPCTSAYPPCGCPRCRAQQR